VLVESYDDNINDIEDTNNDNLPMLVQDNFQNNDYVDDDESIINNGIPLRLTKPNAKFFKVPFSVQKSINIKSSDHVRKTVYKRDFKRREYLRRLGLNVTEKESTYGFVPIIQRN
jgi:hypothetical protein